LKIPCGKLQGIFNRKECGFCRIRSLTPPQAAGSALAIAVQANPMALWRGRKGMVADFAAYSGVRMVD